MNMTDVVYRCPVAEKEMEDFVNSCGNTKGIVVEFKSKKFKWWKQACKDKLLSEERIGELKTEVLKLAVQDTSTANLSELTSLRRRYLNIHRESSIGMMYVILYKFFGGHYPDKHYGYLDELSRLSLTMSHLVKRDIVHLVSSIREGKREE